MLDLLRTLQDLQAWNVSLIAQTGLQLDLRSAQGKLIASLMAAVAEFERDLLRERHVGDGPMAANRPTAHIHLAGRVWGKRSLNNLLQQEEATEALLPTVRSKI